jgi:hypothetical protein
MRALPLIALGISLWSVSGALAAKAYKPPLPPVISVSAEAGEYHTAQTVLSSFIQRLQVGKRAKAAELMSSRVSQAERDAMIRKEWLRYDARDRKNVLQILYWRDLQIHTQQLFKGGAQMTVVSRSIPLKAKPGGTPSGILKVRMWKEAGSWRVELHPPRTARK